MALRLMCRIAEVEFVHGKEQHIRSNYNFDYNSYRDKQLQVRFGLTQVAFHDLLDDLIQSHHDGGSHPIPVYIQLLFTLRFYAISLTDSFI